MKTVVVDMSVEIDGIEYWLCAEVGIIGHIEDNTERGEYFGTPYTHTKHEFVADSAEVLSFSLFAYSAEDIGFDDAVIEPRLLEKAKILAAEYALN